MLHTALALLGTPVHRSIFPYVWGATLHAARISLVFNSQIRASKSQLSVGANLIGYLIMCWGGSLAVHMLLSLPPPHLYTFAPWLNYAAVHLLVSSLLSYLPIPDPAHANALLFPLDGLLRTNSVLQAVSLLNLSKNLNPLLSESPLFHFILGAAASSGGGLLGGTLGVWTSNWQVSTPPPLRIGVWGVWSTLDIWAGGVIACVYGLLTAHPAFLPLRALLTSQKAATIHTARTLSAALMIAFFGLRVLATSPKAPVVQKKPGQKEKTQ
ncbi:hypothetical protein MIND_00050700 [Mycena indigotica]|uniref:Uncharacterized protein n=1 Tax=Mycena indigotica TaxID=2126181 RepID=A0A8H6WG18_9AGAR|nr:uncharacterized protein MIND_00050700 [Mycena indigotica]KAF7315361.1 hypothetical protein MIND_00050700 [Mycena indigotica]